MSTRRRTTWENRLPVERFASEHPAYPDEGLTHPAAYADPEADAYENGDTSSWAEDPHPGPYRTSLAPANPMDDGGYRHPAAQPGAPAKNASLTRQAAERKAAKCIRLAQAMLGKNATVEMIEDQALDFMDFSDARLAMSLRRLEAATEDVNVLLSRMAGEDVEEEVEVDDEEDEDTEDSSDDGKQAFRFTAGDDEEEEEEEDEGKTASSARLAEVLSVLSNLQAQVAALSSRIAGGDAAEDEEESDDSASLVVAGEDEEDEEEAMLASMLAEAQTQQACGEMAVDPVADSFLDDDAGFVDDGDDFVDDIYNNPVDDPMNLDDGTFLSDEDDALLSSLYAGTKFAGDEEEVEVEEKVEKQAARRVASTKPQLRPQPKKPSAGLKALPQIRTASSNDVDELSKLWGSAPDVSNIFGK